MKEKEKLKGETHTFFISTFEAAVNATLGEPGSVGLGKPYQTTRCLFNFRIRKAPGQADNRVFISMALRRAKP